MTHNQKTPPIKGKTPAADLAGQRKPKSDSTMLNRPILDSLELSKTPAGVLGEEFKNNITFGIAMKTKEEGGKGMHSRPNAALFRKLSALKLPLLIYKEKNSHSVKFPEASILDMDFLFVNPGETFFISVPIPADTSEKELLKKLEETISTLIDDKDNKDFKRFFIIPRTSNHYVTIFHPNTLEFLKEQKKKLLHEIRDFDLGADFLKTMHYSMGASKIPHDIFMQDIVERVWELRNIAGMINDTRYIRGPPVSSKMIKTGIHVHDSSESTQFSKIIFSFNFGDDDCSNHLFYVEPHLTREDKKKFCVSCLIPLEALKEAAQKHELSTHLLHKFEENRALLEEYIDKLNFFLCDPVYENFNAALEARKNIEIHLLDERQNVKDYKHVIEIFTELGCD
ncbi:MAG: hypothetical protein ABIH99_00120 [Candidatus Micrarchaeota archaeon]